MIRTFRYRIYPSPAQIQMIEHHVKLCKHVYNWGMDEKKRSYEETGKSLSWMDLQNIMVQHKATTKTWLCDAFSQSLIHTLQTLDRHYKDYFRGNQRYPHYRVDNYKTPSLHFPSGVGVDWDSSEIRFPKLKGIRACLHRTFEGKIKTVTLKRSVTGKYFASILVEDGLEVPTKTTVDPELTVGLKLGIETYVTTSDGNVAENPLHLENSLVLLQSMDKRLSRMRSGSKNRDKLVKERALLCEKISNRRLDFVNKLAHHLVDESKNTSYSIVDLDIKGLLEQRKKSRNLADSSFGMFYEKLERKCELTGKNILSISQKEYIDLLADHTGDVELAKAILQQGLSEAKG